MRQNHVTDLCDSCVVDIVFSSVLWRARRATGSAHARGRDHWRATCRLLHNVLELKQQTNLVGSRRELLATRCSRAVARSADSIVAILFYLLKQRLTTDLQSICSQCVSGLGVWPIVAQGIRGNGFQRLPNILVEIIIQNKVDINATVFCKWQKWLRVNLFVLRPVQSSPNYEELCKIYCHFLILIWLLSLKNIVYSFHWRQ